MSIALTVDSSLCRKANAVAEDLIRLRATINATGVTKSIRKLVFTSDSSAVIKKCISKLDFEMGLFQVSVCPHTLPEHSG